MLLMPEYKTFISKEEINELPLLEFEGRLEVVENLDHASRAIKELSEHKILGFDTETRPSFTKGEVYQVAMLQLASPEATYLFRLNKISLPLELANLLADPNITKAGVAIRDDLKGLQKLNHFDPGGFVDIAKVVEKRGFTSLGLRALAGIFLGIRLSKAAKVTNWERSNLTEAQLTYAALDAVVGLRIFEKLLEGDFDV